MKKLVTLIVILLFFNGFAQSLSNTEIAKLNRLSINIEHLDFDNLSVQKDLNDILKLEKKRKTNLTVAIVLSSIAASGVILGGTLFNTKNTISDTLGGVIIAGGVLYGSVSIPFWIASHKRKKERNRLIRMLNK